MSARSAATLPIEPGPDGASAAGGERRAGGQRDVTSAEAADGTCGRAAPASGPIQLDPICAGAPISATPKAARPAARAMVTVPSLVST